MSLRLKLLLALLPLALALVVVGVTAVWSLTALGVQAQLILRDNYRSVLAAQEMQESLEGFNNRALLVIAGRDDEQIPSFDKSAHGSRPA